MRERRKRRQKENRWTSHDEGYNGQNDRIVYILWRAWYRYNAYLFQDFYSQLKCISISKDLASQMLVNIAEVIADSSSREVKLKQYFLEIGIVSS